MSSYPMHAYGDPEGPFTASQVREGDPYELSNGHAIRCMSVSERHGKANLQGGALASDPQVMGNAGTDVGIEFNEGKNLRAPDLVIGIEGRPGWSKSVPAICVEYADRGQDEAQLQEKIAELLAFGVRHIWVVRLLGPLRVEVYEPGKKMDVVDADGMLTAPGVLTNSYTPRELVDQQAAFRAAFRNQLQAQGYQSLDDVRQEARQEADRARQQAEAQQRQAEAELRLAIKDICELLGIELSQARRQQLESMDASALRALRHALKSRQGWPG